MASSTRTAFTMSTSSAQHAATTGRAAANPDRTLSRARIEEYPEQLWWACACFLAVIAVAQLFSFVHSSLAKRQPSWAEKARSPGRHAPSLRRLPLAAVNAFRVLAFRTTLSIGQSYTLNLAEVFVTVAYITALFTWAFINTTDQTGERYSLNYWANRAGTLAASQIPLLTALGTKNNFVSLIICVSYDKLNYIHRMMARVLMVLLWVHAGAWISRGTASRDQEETWLRCGALGLSALSLLCMLSIRPVRGAAYEVFFYAHFVLVLLFMVGEYVHVKEFTSSKWSTYLWASMLIWGLDRAMRIARLVAFNHSYFGLAFFSRSGKATERTLDATPELLSDHFVRLRMRRPRHFHWRPGQTAYLILPGVSKLPFEAHPFTIASFESQAPSSSDASPAADDQKGTDADRDMDTTPYWRELVFLINVRRGFTSRLKAAAIDGRTVKAYVDGPYGPAPDLRCFDACVLAAGGTGVAYTLPVFLDIVEQVKSRKSVCRRVTFIWAMRDGCHIHWIAGTISKALALAPPELHIAIRVFVTGADEGSLNNASGDADTESLHSSAKNTLTGDEKDRNSSGDGKERPLALFASPAYVARKGRPDLPALLAEEAASVSGCMAVSVCGSHSIAQSVRRGLGFGVAGPREVMRGAPSVSLYVESFGYA